jgi:LCP family protein required for cell wall assembly
VNVFVGLCLLSAALLYGYVRYRSSQLKTAKCPSCVAATGATSGGLKPMNILLIGSNTLGIPINHYVDVNFDGFRRSIDAMGGIDMSFPTRLRDTYSGLNITRTGCQAINGATALAVVRARHLQYWSNGRWVDDPLSDLARIRRDHTFLRIFVNRAKGQVSNPLRLNALIGGLLNQVTVDSGLNVTSMLDLFRRFRHLDPDTVPETTLPITVVPSYRYGGGAYGDVDMPVEPLDQQVISAWAGNGTTASGLVAVPPTPPVRVVNISGIAHQAADVGAQLAAYGYPIAATTTASQPAATTETVIRYQPGSVAAALGLLGRLSGAVMMAPDATITDGSLTLDVGSVVAVNPPAPPAPATAAGSAAPATSVPTALHQTPSSAQDQPQPYDPTACPPAA